MAIPGIPHCPTAQLWDAIVALVRSNAPLMGALKLVQLHEGRATDLEKWSTATLPALRFTPASGGSRWSAEAQHDASLIVHAELLVGSSYAGDMMDLWWAIKGVFFPGDNSVLDALQEQYGVHTISMTDPAWSTVVLDDGARVLNAAGSFRFDQHLNT